MDGNSNPILRLNERNKSFIEIEDEKIAVRPRRRHAVMFSQLEEMKPEERTAYIETIMTEMLKDANDEVSDEQLELFIATNYGQIYIQLAKIFGFVNTEQYDKLKAQLEKKFESL